MRLLRPIVLVAGLVALALTSSAGAGHDPGKSKDMIHLANVPNADATNSDLAFWGNLVFAGNYNGFRIIDASTPSAPVVLADVTCRGAQSDVGVWGNGERLLLFTSIDRRQVKEECSENAPPGPEGWEGIRIWDVTDPRNPVFVKGVATDCGSHTHTVVPDRANNRALIYVSSYPLTDPGPNCVIPHSKISVVEVPMDSPENASVISEPSVGPSTIGCHDIGVFLELEIAAAACLTEGQLWDISDRVNPQIVARITNPLINIWHSGAFTWDGKIAIFGDEEGGAAGTHGCTPPRTPPGAVWFYDREDPSSPLGFFAIPRDQFIGDQQTTCTIHNYNVVPVKGRYVLVSAAYEAGTSVIDFTDPANAREIAFFDAKGRHTGRPASAWSSYWYRGLVYANDIGRGVDIFRVTRREVRGAERFGHLNPQTQERLLR